MNPDAKLLRDLAACSWVEEIRSQPTTDLRLYLAVRVPPRSPEDDHAPSDAVDAIKCVLGDRNAWLGIYTSSTRMPVWPRVWARDPTLWGRIELTSHERKDARWAALHAFRLGLTPILDRLEDLHACLKHAGFPPPTLDELDRTARAALVAYRDGVNQLYNTFVETHPLEASRRESDAPAP